MSSDLVTVVFRLYHLPDYAWTIFKYKDGDSTAVHVGLLGTIPELGDWELGNHLIAKPSRSDPDMWWVTAQIRVRKSFQMSWLVADKDRNILFWDPANNHRVQLSHHDVVVQVSWSRDPTYLFSRTCNLILKTHYSCREGEALAVIGSPPCLGAWNPRGSVRAEEYPRMSGNWQSRAEIATNQEYEWKWVVIDAHNGQVKRWEECRNRFVSTNCERLVILASWNSPSSILSHSPQIYEQTINMDKMAKMHDAIVRCGDLETEHVASMWSRRWATGEKPFAITETERTVAMELKAKLDQKHRADHPNITRARVIRLCCVLMNVLRDPNGYNFVF